jgi:hypothetical protein
MVCTRLMTTKLQGRSQRRWAFWLLAALAAHQLTWLLLFPQEVRAVQRSDLELDFAQPDQGVVPGRDVLLENRGVEASNVHAWLVPKLQRHEATRYE